MPTIRLRFVLLPAAVGLAAAVLLWPSPADAQCGTQASSCKNCHEVEAQDPVNAEGAWHVDHAFGDFCEFCHGGNVAATEQDSAHEAMYYPLGDVALSCASCHPADYEDLALQYAETLGVGIDTAVAAARGASEGSPPASGESAVEAAPPAQGEAAPAETSDDTGGAVIDLNDRYADRESEAAASVNVGNIILSVMLVGLIGVFGVLIWHFEGFGEKWVQLRGATSPARAVQEAAGAPVIAPRSRSSEALQSLLPTLERANPATLASLGKLLEADPERGGQMIEALARLDPRLVEAVRRLDDQDLELLIALVRELKERNS